MFIKNNSFYCKILFLTFLYLFVNPKIKKGNNKGKDMNKKILFFVLFVLINFNISIVPSASANLPDLIISEAKAAIKDKTRPTVYFKPF